MQNYKVRVNNEAENKEVQGLFEQLGLENAGDCDERSWIASDQKSFSGYRNTAWDYHWFIVSKELTIQQLRNLVAAKTKKIPYLVKTIDKWEEQQLTSDTPESATCVRIPDGAIELLYSESNNSKYHFVRLNGDLMSVTDILDGEEYWYKDKLKYKNWGSVNVVWQRSPKNLPTHPEEIPFIDDEPKMADIEQTLNERQSQYGDFSDVAETIQSMYLMLLNDDMTDVEREALHMICSKLSRIKHGDCHKIDSWHDIGGYATLVVKDLEKNNE